MRVSSFDEYLAVVDSGLRGLRLDVGRLPRVVRLHRVLRVLEAKVTGSVLRVLEAFASWKPASFGSCSTRA